jgi:predicted amidohydrolase
MKIAIGQFAATTQTNENLQTVVKMTEDAAAQGAEFVLFPEYAMFKQPVRDAQFLDACEPLDGPFASGLRALAKRLGVYLLCGLNEKIEGGADIGIYRKVHLYDAFGGRESDWIRPGGTDQATVFRIGELNCGVLTCYDIRFPEITRQLVDNGAEVILLPTAWTAGTRKEDHWMTLVRARAIENTAYVIGADQAPPGGTSGSVVIDPMGVVVAELGEGPGILLADVKPERVRAVRERNPSLQHRRYKVVPLAKDEWIKLPTP